MNIFRIEKNRFYFCLFQVLLLACMFAYCAGNPYFQTHHQHVDIERVQFEAETFGKDEIGMCNFLDISFSFRHNLHNRLEMKLVIGSGHCHVIGACLGLYSLYCILILQIFGLELDVHAPCPMLTL